MPANKTKQKLEPEGFSLISNDKLLALYAALLKCRRIARGSKDEPSLGSAVGVVIDLLAGDTLAASRAGAMARFVKGKPLGRALNGRDLSDEAALKTVLSKALANQAAKRTRVAVAFCGGPKIAPALWREPMHAAAKKRLPIVFVASAIPESLGVDSFELPRSFPAIVVDSDDVVAIYRVASEAIGHARRGNGPTLILCKPWPFAKRKDDAVRNMEKYLAGKKLLSARFKARTVAAFARELREATS